MLNFTTLNNIFFILFFKFFKNLKKITERQYKSLKIIINNNKSSNYQENNDEINYKKKQIKTLAKIKILKIISRKIYFY